MWLVLLGLVIAIPIVIALFAIGIYNGLVSRRNRFKNLFSQIDVQLKRRYDLIPNLVETAKGYLKHEKETLENVIAARNQAMSAGKAAAENPADAETMKRFLSAESGLAGSLGRFMMIAESYPDLKANQTMGQLMEELSSTENRIGFARQAYNDSVMDYNTARESFPNNVVAGMFHFQPASLFEIENPKEKEAVKVSFT